MSRKIKDIKDKHTGELVYPRTHASAVVLSSDSTLEDLVDVKQDKIDDLDEIRAGAAKGATALQSVPSEYVTETELSNKGYATISALNNKVDTVNGKQLSTEDFTTALKTKLEGLNNYDDTELSNAVETLRGDFDSIVSGDTTTAIKTFNEVIAFLDGLTDTQDLESIIASIEQQIAGKMDKVTLATVATSGSYNDLSNKPIIPTKTSELENDSNYIVIDEYGDAYIDGTLQCNQVHCDRISMGAGDMGLRFDEEGIHAEFAGGLKFLSITNTGDGTKFLSDDGTYKTIDGGSSNTNGIVMNVEHIIPTNSTISFLGTEQCPSMKANTIYVQQSGSHITNTLDILEIESFEETTEPYAEYVIIFVFNSPLWGSIFSIPSYVKWANGITPSVYPEVVYELNISRSILAGEVTYCAVLTPFNQVE